MSSKVVYKEDNEESNVEVNEGLNNSSSENGISIQTRHLNHSRSQVNNDASNANSEANSHLQLSFSQHSSNSSLRHRRNSSITRNTLILTNSQINTNANSEDEINLSACPDSVPNFSRPTETVSHYRNDPNVYSSGLELTSSSEINGNYGGQFTNPNMYFFRNGHASSESFQVSSQEGALNLSGYDDRVVRAGGENAPQPTESSGGRHRSRDLFGSSSSDLSMITAFENFNLQPSDSTASIATDEILDEISSFIMSESSATSQSSDSSDSTSDDGSFSGMLPAIESMTDRLTAALEALQSTMSCEGGRPSMSDQMINNFNRLRRRSLQTAENAAETVRNMNSFLSTYQANDEGVEGRRGYAQMTTISERLRNVSDSLTSALQAIQTEMNRSSAPESVSAGRRSAERVGSSKSRRKNSCKAEKPAESKKSEEKGGPKKPAVIKCPVCFKTYDDLMACDSHLVHGRCGHVICNICAEILKNERLIRCPVCRKRLKSLGGNPFKRVYLATE